MILVILPTLLPPLPPHKHPEIALGLEFHVYKVKSWFLNNGQIILPFEELKKLKVENKNFNQCALNRGDSTEFLLSCYLYIGTFL